MSSASEVVIVPNVKDNMLKKLLVIGKTGTGKSSLCNRIAGHEANAPFFPVSSAATSCTQRTKFGNIKFGGNKERVISLIDTIGFDDPENDTDIKIIAELVDKLRNNCDYVNLFAIAVNGAAPRLDGALVAMIKIFEEMFGPGFWSQCVLIFTRVSMDKKQKKMRLKNTEKSDDDIAKDYLKVVQGKFPKGEGLDYLFLDACFDEDDEEEVKAFEEAMEDLYSKVDGATPLQTSRVNENVQSEHGKLKRELEAREKDMVEFTEKIQEMEKEMDMKMREAEMNRSNNEEGYQRQLALYDRQIEYLQQATENRVQLYDRQMDYMQQATENREQYRTENRAPGSWIIDLVDALTALVDAFNVEWSDSDSD